MKGKLNFRITLSLTLVFMVLSIVSASAFAAMITIGKLSIGP